jgi:DNA processing protein
LPSNLNTLWDRELCPTLISLACTFSASITTKKFFDLYNHYGLSIPLEAKAITLAEKELELAKEHTISIIPIVSNEYPERLKVLPDAPLVLYVKGKLPPPDAISVGIVGTRAATNWGMECTAHFAKHLAYLGAWTISGLARGIDTAAHKASLERTCAIIGSGLLHIYPQENIQLAREIPCVMSELPLRCAPTKYSFPKRNRLIAALSSCLLLTEAPLKSGAMITMNIGHKLKKPLFTVPGRAMNENYEGNHALLKEQKARLVDSPQELANLLSLAHKPPPEKTINSLLISPQEQKILDILFQNEVSIEELSVKSCLPINLLQVSLTKLVLRKLAAELPGKRYKGIG